MIKEEINLLTDIITHRIKFRSEFYPEDMEFPPLDPNTAYGRYIMDNRLSKEERLMLILSLVPSIMPVYYEDMFSAEYFYTYHENRNINSTKCPKYHSGITKIPDTNTFVATGNTFLFLWCDQDIDKRMSIVSKLMMHQFPLVASDRVMIVTNDAIAPFMNGLLIPKPELLAHLISDYQEIMSG